MQHVQPWKPSSIFHTSEAAATAAPAYAAASAAATGPGGAPPHKPSCSASASSAAGNVTLRTVALFGWRMGGTVRWSHWAAVQLAPAPAYLGGLLAAFFRLHPQTSHGEPGLFPLKAAAARPIEENPFVGG